MKFKNFIIIIGLTLLSMMSFAATKPLNSPQGLALDAKGNLYVANSGGNQILIYNPNYVQQTARTISKNVTSPTSVAIDVVGNIWVANLGGGPSGVGSITEYSSTGVQDTNRTITDGVDYPYSIATDGIGDIWVENNFNTLTVYANFGSTIPLQTIPFSAPITGITARNTYIAIGGNTTSTALEIAPSLTGSFSAGIGAPSSAYSLAWDARGNLYCGTINGALNVVNLNAGIASQLVTLGYFPWGVAVDSVRGRVYVSDANHNQINVYNATTGALLHTIQ